MIGRILKHLPFQSHRMHDEFKKCPNILQQNVSQNSLTSFLSNRNYRAEHSVGWKGAALQYLVWITIVFLCLN